MDIKKIEQIVNTKLSDEQKEYLILCTISDDKNAIPTILQILDREREQREELILDSNSELSRALLVLKDKNLKWNKKCKILKKEKKFAFYLVVSNILLTFVAKLITIKKLKL